MRRYSLTPILSFLLAISCQQSPIISEQPHAGTKIITGTKISGITRICEDGHGSVWMSVRQNGLLRWDGGTLLHFNSDIMDPESISANMVNHLIIDNDGELWAGTQQGIDRFDRTSGAFVHYELDDFNSYIVRMFKDPEGNIYAQNRRGILRLDRNSGVFRKVLSFPDLTSSEPYPLKDNLNNLWVRYGNRILLYNKDFQLIDDIKTGSTSSRLTDDGDRSLLFLDNGRLHALDIITHLPCELPSGLAGLAEDIISSISEIGDDLLFFRMEGGDALFMKSTRMLFRDSDMNMPVSRILDIPEAVSFMYDSKGNIWYTRRDGSYAVLELVGSEESDYHELANYLKDHVIRSRASNGRYLWILTSDNSILTFDLVFKSMVGITGLAGLTNSSTTFSQIHCTGGNRIFLNAQGRSNNAVYSLMIDSNGMPQIEHKYTSDRGIIACSDAFGGVWGAEAGMRFSHASKQQIHGENVRMLPVEGLMASVNELAYPSVVAPLRNGDIMVGYTDSNPVILSPSDGSTRFLDIFDEDVQVFYTVMMEDSKGNLWLGTSDNGLIKYSYKTGVKESFDFVRNLGVGDIQEDSEGNIIILAGDRLLSILPGGTGKEVLLYEGHESFSHSSSSMLVLPDNTIYLFMDGNAISFKSSDINNVKVLETDLNITLASAGHELVSLSTSDFRKNHRMRLKFRSIPDDMDMYLAINDGKVNPAYENFYKVNGHGRDLRETPGGIPIALYNLHYGTNRIRFKLRRTDIGSESPEYTIAMKFPFPLTYWIIGLFSILLLGTLSYVLIESRKRQNDADNERSKREMQEEINIRNMDFFANISHEFRAPLTLINGAIAQLNGSSISEQEQKHTLSIVNRNVARMLKLVTQMLDFNKLDHDMLKLNVGPANISDVIRRSWEIFEIGAGQKNIDFNLYGCDEEIFGYADYDKLEKIVYNLLSNALKFTPPGGRIDVECSQDGGMLTVSVKDTGIGIEEDDLDTIFDRFNQTEASRKAGGTGIGLYFTKALVEMHHGRISVVSRKNEGNDRTMSGSIFTFSIPINEDAYSDEEKESSVDMTVSADRNNNADENMDSPQLSEYSSDKPNLLLIDDDYEVIYYLRSLLSSKYNVYFRFDAMSGYSQIKTINPDAIICDMMMMDVDGLQLCRMVKENIEMCHIPVIMLTARSSVEDQVRSLDVGVDAYVTKPFNPDYLLALIKSQIENRNRTRSILTSSTSLHDKAAESMNVKDKAFMEKVYQQLEKCLIDGEIDVDSFSASLNVSRSKFFYKIKALTGQTPGEFFTTYKMNRAAKLILEDKYKITAIAAMVGFNSPSHFSNVFKKQFGVLPSQYMDEHERNKQQTEHK